MTAFQMDNSTKVPASLQPNSDSIEQPKLKLIYRGNAFDYIPRPTLASKEDRKDGKTVTLIYRGNTFERQIPSPKPYQKPRAINWRWKYE